MSAWTGDKYLWKETQETNDISSPWRELDFSLYILLNFEHEELKHKLIKELCHNQGQPPMAKRPLEEISQPMLQ